MDLTQPVNLLADFNRMISDRSDFETMWRGISKWLLPDHGVFTYTSKPRPKQRALSRIMNDVAEDALDVLTAGLQAGLTSPARKWFSLEFDKPHLNKIIPLRTWLDECVKVLYSAFQASNFYSIIHSFYTEYAGFGIGAIYFGADADPFRFEVCEIGTYAIAEGPDHRVNKLYRVLFKSAKNVVDTFPDTVSDRVKRMADTYPEFVVPVLHAVFPQKKGGKPFTSVYLEYLNSGSGTYPYPTETSGSVSGTSEDRILRVSGFHEFPFLVSRWELIGDKVYGPSPGKKAVPSIMRLQEIEKAQMLATHKEADPPLNAPARMQGQIRKLPGGINYYDNPNETVNEVYRIRRDLNPSFTNIERIEKGIKTKFFNELFLTASRDPNLSPLKAAEVYERKDERMIRLGPTVERAQYEILSPLINRGFNIAGRKGMVPPFPMEFADEVQNYKIVYTSPLAEAQKQLGMAPISNFLQTFAGVLQLAPEARDKVNADRLVDEIGETTGAPAVIFNTEEEIAAIRQQRAEEARRQQQIQDAAMQQGMSLDAEQKQADIAKTYSEAGVNANEVLGNTEGTI